MQKHQVKFVMVTKRKKEKEQSKHLQLDFNNC